MPSDVLPQLLELLCDLYEDTEGFLDRQDDPQVWYNRGYANGMIDGLTRLGYLPQVVSAVEPDPPDVASGQEALPWGKAYRHGWEMGRRETDEVMGAS
jgi:hypothetical protein